MSRYRLPRKKIRSVKDEQNNQAMSETQANIKGRATNSSLELGKKRRSQFVALERISDNFCEVAGSELSQSAY